MVVWLLNTCTPSFGPVDWNRSYPNLNAKSITPTLKLRWGIFRAPCVRYKRFLKHTPQGLPCMLYVVSCLARHNAGIAMRQFSILNCTRTSHYVLYMHIFCWNDCNWYLILLFDSYYEEHGVVVHDNLYTMIIFLIYNAGSRISTRKCVKTSNCTCQGNTQITEKCTCGLKQCTAKDLESRCHTIWRSLGLKLLRG